jgi:hypothetical protein
MARIPQVNSFVGAFHDAVILYALALNETLEAGHNATNGMEVTRRMWNRTFEGEQRGIRRSPWHQGSIPSAPLIRSTSIKRDKVLS